MAKTPTNTLADLSPAAILALAKMLPESVINDARDQVDAGEHDIECVLHLRGEIIVEEDSENLQVNKLDPMTLFQVAMEKLNTVSIEAVVREACERLKKKEAARRAKQKQLEAEANGKKVKLPKVDDEPEMKEFKEKVKDAYDRLAQKTLQRRRGSVCFEGQLSPVES